MEFGRILKELRKTNGIAQDKLAQEIGFSKGIISEWESGKKNPNSAALIALSRYFNVSADYLLGLDPDFQPPYIPPRRASEITEDLPPEDRELADEFLRFLSERRKKS